MQGFKKTFVCLSLCYARKQFFPWVREKLFIFHIKKEVLK